MQIAGTQQRLQPAGALVQRGGRRPQQLIAYTGFRAGGLLGARASPSLQAVVGKAVTRVAQRSGAKCQRARTSMMFERFTEKAIKVVMLAQEEARRLGHNFVGTEQILLGLIGESTGEWRALRGRPGHRD